VYIAKGYHKRRSWACIPNLSYGKTYTTRTKRPQTTGAGTMNSVDFNKFADSFFYLDDMQCVYQAKVAQAFILWKNLSNLWFFPNGGINNTKDAFLMCKKVLIKKGTEYSTDDDKLHNFKQAAEISGHTPVHCAEMFQLKHTTSINDMLNNMRNKKTKEMLNEKFVDYINYCVLIAALKKEEANDINV
jgi:hypothetical protein